MNEYSPLPLNDPGITYDTMLLAVVWELSDEQLEAYPIAVPKNYEKPATVAKFIEEQKSQIAAEGPGDRPFLGSPKQILLADGDGPSHMRVDCVTALQAIDDAIRFGRPVYGFDIHTTIDKLVQCAFEQRILSPRTLANRSERETCVDPFDEYFGGGRASDFKTAWIPRILMAATAADGKPGENFIHTHDAEEQVRQLKSVMKLLLRR